MFRYLLRNLYRLMIKNSLKIKLRFLTRNKLVAPTLWLFLLPMVMSCSQQKAAKIIIIENPISLDRSLETIELTKVFLGLSDDESLSDFDIREASTKEPVITQYVDKNTDGITDALLFQCSIEKMGRKEYEVVSKTADTALDTTIRCYSRFVPERIDDYAWENNKVAFRTYGPTAQKLTEDNMPGGTLSSGIDAWLKKVEYPVINKWYKKTTDKTGSYHKDTGEGLDNFHVGSSRGVGGIAIKSEGTFYTSKNFTSWKTITNGPIRTSFELSYEDWDANGDLVKEKKLISLDYGSNLSKFEISVSNVDTASIGLTLHENDGLVTANVSEGWLSYWQPHDGSELGTAIVEPNGELVGYDNYVTPETDGSHLYGYIKASDNVIVYYAGFGWKESGQFTKQEEWEDYLSKFAKMVRNPLTVTLK